MKITIHAMHLSNKNITKFMKRFSYAANNKIDVIKFIEAWNLHAKNIDEHVFYTLESR